RLMSSERISVTRVSKAPNITSSTGILNELGWQQRRSSVHSENKDQPLTIRLAHSLGKMKMTDDSLNRFRRVFLDFDGRLLSKINPWNYQDRIILNNQFTPD
ncbi:unnamed protein product, partial [Adineta ricciae]